MPRKKKRTGASLKKLTPRQKKLAPKFIREEVKTKKYPREQAVAIGLSRARQATKKRPRKKKIKR